MRTYVLLAAAAMLTLGAGPAMAQKKQLVIVVKGLDNPFFEAINQGCQKWNSENADAEYECFYTGPASTSDEAGEAQIVQDLLGSPNTAAMAISPSNARLIAQTIRNANPTVPISRPRTPRCARPISAPTTTSSASGSANTPRKPSPTAARSAPSRAIRGRTTSCSGPRVSVTPSAGRRA